MDTSSGPTRREDSPTRHTHSSFESTYTEGVEAPNSAVHRETEVLDEVVRRFAIGLNRLHPNWYCIAAEKHVLSIWMQMLQ